MLSIDVINKIIIVVLTIVICVCCLGIVIAIKFQNKQKNKYKECIRLIKEKENGTLSIKNGLDIDEIKQIDRTIDVSRLMLDLYDTYIEFVDKLNRNDRNFSGILDDFIKELYENKIDIYSAKGYFEIIDNIELVNYSILEFFKEKLKFRINITCFNYKKNNNQIVSGSNLKRVEQIYILTYIKQNKKWLINNIEKVFEKS